MWLYWTAMSRVINVVVRCRATSEGVVNLLRTMLVTMIFAICEMLVIVSGGIDVSFPAISSLAMIVTVHVMLDNKIESVFFAFALGCLIGAGLGLLNAILIAVFKIPPLIATLGVSSMTSGFPCILHPFPHTVTRQSKRAKGPAAVEGTRDARTSHPARHAFPIARPSGCIPERRQSQAAGQSQQQRCGAHSPAASSAIAELRTARHANRILATCLNAFDCVLEPR